MRTYALYDRKPWAKWFLFTIFTIEIGALIAGEIIFTIQAKHTAAPLLIPGATCVYTLYSLSYAVGIVIFGVSAAYDLSIFLMTALRIFRLYRDGRSRLVDVVLRDCLLYFGILFTANFISFLLYVTIPEDRAALRSLLVTPSRAIAVILVARILLNLRRVVTTGHITTDTLTVSVVSDLQWNPDPGSEKKDNRNGRTTSRSGSSGNGRTRVGVDSLVFSKAVTTTTMSEDIEMR
ncbi:hypothetical protein QCA50_016078 [Cerrena zonata]|uniref:Uncharacterized protein n=1 Tax=Cerrena zonata TaxID=2478898 RepID=A0AAW0FVN3_9APHY